jgi:hypothetical protein
MLRNKAVAHAEFEFYPIAQLPVPAKSQSNTGFATTSKRWHPVNAAIDLDAFRDIAEKMKKACLNAAFDLAGAPQFKS